jgi:hypothetical protein
MRQNEDMPVAGRAAMVAIGGSAGAMLASSTLERAVLGLVLGMAIGLGAHAIWRSMLGRSVPRSAAPTAHPA